MTLPARSGSPLRLCRSEEHTSELQSQSNLVCRLLLEKKNDASPLPPHRPTPSSPRFPFPAKPQPPITGPPPAVASPPGERPPVTSSQRTVQPDTLTET